MNNSTMIDRNQNADRQPATPLPARQPNPTSIDRHSLTALAPVKDASMGARLRLARLKTQQQIDEQIAERLRRFLKSMANRD